MRFPRLAVLLGAAALVAAPAALLRGFCVGNTCDAPADASARVPFCSLPDELRVPIAAGFREGRSPDVMGATGAVTVGVRGGRSTPALWPSVDRFERSRVPLVFAGRGVNPDADPVAGTKLEDVAPTVSQIIGLERPHPEVRVGEAIADVASGTSPRVVVEIVLAGVGSERIEENPTQWPFLRRLLGAGAGTLEADPGSLPLDDASVLTTIGTGGPPAQHGIPGTIMRDDAGDLTRAWSRSAPVSVIATLGDDLDHVLDERPRIGLIAGKTTDRGLIGGDWYVDVDRDDIETDPADPVRAARALLQKGYGRDSAIDLLGVVLRGRDNELDHDLRGIVREARRATRGSVALVVTATGAATERAELDVRSVVRTVERMVGRDTVEAAAIGGLFLDQGTLADRGISEDEVLGALADIERRGERVFADGWTAITVSFSRYC